MWFFYVMLSMLGWALVNVLDSLLVKHYEKNPLVLMWSQSIFSIPILLVLPYFVDIHSSWAGILLAFGVLGFLGDLWFFHVLDRLDVSVANAAWPLLSIFLSIIGFLFFSESWTMTQTIGAVLVISGAFLLSFFHQHISLTRTLGLLVTLALLYLPYYVIKKAAIDDGQSPVSVFYWMILSRETFACTFPWFRTSSRTRIKALVQRMDMKYFLIGGAVIASFFFAEYAGALSYIDGPLSLVSVVNNIQPFVVILIAAFLARLLPSRAAREVFTQRSLTVKLCSFTIVFIGLALLGLST